MKKLILPILLISFICFSSCKKDTCNNKLGDTFQNIDSLTINQNGLGTYDLNANMLTLDDLTEAYFQATTLIVNDKDRFGNEWPNDDAIVEEIKFQKTSFTIEFKEIDLVNYGEIALHFRLRDRKEFIDCDHGGSGDSYFLNVQFSVSADSSGILNVANFQWEEEFDAGAH